MRLLTEEVRERPFRIGNKYLKYRTRSAGNSQQAADRLRAATRHHDHRLYGARVDLANYILNLGIHEDILSCSGVERPQIVVTFPVIPLFDVISSEARNLRSVLVR